MGRPDLDEDDLFNTSTLTIAGGDDGQVVSRRLRIQVIAGPDAGAATTVETGLAVIGTSSDAALQISDPTVSRRHVELRAVADGVYLIDLESKNGTRVSGVAIKEALLTSDGDFQIGETHIRVAVLQDAVEVSSADVENFGGFLTCHPPLKKSIELLRRVAGSTATVLIEGSTGTGKELLARAVHAHSARSQGPYVVIDCGAVSPTLLESQLFGHRKGAFTGAVADHVGAFEAAGSGTVFLDELAELPLDLQPKLLRALEARTICRVGEVNERHIDVRFVAATNKDLARRVAEHEFRDDLYYRVAVVRVRVPDLRERPEDVPLIASHYARSMSEGKVTIAPETFATLSQYHWPGNARELRNVLQRAMALARGAQLTPEDIFSHASPARSATFHEAKDQLLASFERGYVQSLLERHDGNVSRAAKEAGLSRNALYALMKRTGWPES